MTHPEHGPTIRSGPNMHHREKPLRGRQPCPRCGGIELRTLRLSGEAKRHHQCLVCAHRFSRLSAPPAAHAPRLTGLDRASCLARLPRNEREDIGVLIRLMTGKGTRVDGIELTERVLHEFQQEHGEPSAVMRGFVYPVFTWLARQDGHGTVHLVVIDQGDMRVCFRVQRWSACGPL